MQAKTVNIELPLFYQHNINEYTKLGIWKITEPAGFFTGKVPLQREITHPHKKLQHLAGRYLLRQLFSDFPYEEILIADTRKPYLPYEQYHFSISHCGDYAAAIVSSDSRVGIDIEIPTVKIEKIKHKFLNEEELSKVQQVNAKSDIRNPTSEISTLEVLTVLWSAKEAVFKWWGWGSVDFSEHILLGLSSFSGEGNMKATFVREKETFPLWLHYKLFEGLCLVWVVS